MTTKPHAPLPRLTLDCGCVIIADLEHHSGQLLIICTHHADERHNARIGQRVVDLLASAK